MATDSRTLPPGATRGRCRAEEVGSEDVLAGKMPLIEPSILQQFGLIMRAGFEAGFDGPGKASHALMVSSVSAETRKAQIG